MESVCIGAFLLIFLVAAIVIAYPVSLVIGAITYYVRKNDQNRFPQAVVVTVLTFLFMVILACIALLIWNPRI
jgi:ABC-type transport system involved in multi-copper enzyme maturation permease subunit